MGFVIFVVLVAGYAFFGNFWWILWMPLAALGIFIVWVLLLALEEWAVSKRSCPVCRNWIRSVVMVDYANQQELCNKHRTRRIRIWRLESDLGFALSGVKKERN